MTRRLTAKRLARATEVPANPLEGMANLVDVMLVLAVGIMLALVINWNVDLAVVSAANKAEGNIDTTDALTFRDEDMRSAEEGGDPGGEAMKKLGAVYYDSRTGIYYIVESED